MGSRLLMMRLLSNLMLSRGRTRTWLMRSRTFLTNWVMVVGPSMSWTSNVVAWRLRRRNFKLPLRKLKQHWSKRRTRFLGLNLSLDRSAKRLTAVSKRRRKSLITLARTINVPWTPWVLLLKLNSVPRLKLSESRRSLNLTSMSLKLPLTMPTRPMLKDKRLSSATKANSVIPSKAMHNKRGLESVIHTLQAEIDDALTQAKNSEEKSKRAMVDAARLADELRSEQDHVNAEGRAKRAYDSQLGELEARLVDAEANAAKGGKAAMAKLEMRIRELEMELGSVQSRTGESYKAFQRAERRVKELQFQQDEDRKNQDRMGELANKLQQKIKTYKQQIEEAEEIAALNLAKYRKAQQEFEETEERAKIAGVQLETLRPL